MSHYSPRIAPLGGAFAYRPDSTYLRRQRKGRNRAAKTGALQILFTLGLAIAIVIGLIALRAAIWLPPSGI
jgi:hypothetical protein